MDWAARWRDLAEARAEQTRRLQGDREDLWGERAGMFARSIGAADPFLDAVRARLKPGDTVLDVGAGAGRYAIPLAAEAKLVTAVDGSPGMIERLRAEADERGLSNVTTVVAAWQAADVPPADVVICAHVVYFVADIVPFLRKLDDHARRICMIALRVDQRDAVVASLFREVWGEDRRPEPGFIELYNLLYQLGIVANVRIVEGGGMPPVTSRDQLLAAVRRVLLDPDPDAGAAIDAFLRARAVQDSEGRLRILGAQSRVACVWWEKRNGQGATGNA